MGVSLHTQGLSPRKWEGLCPDAVLEQVRGGSLRREIIVPEPTKDSSLGISRRASGDRPMLHTRGVLPSFAVAGITNRAPTRPPIPPGTAPGSPCRGAWHGRSVAPQSPWPRHDLLPYLSESSPG